MLLTLTVRAWQLDFSVYLVSVHYLTWVQPPPHLQLLWILTESIYLPLHPSKFSAPLTPFGLSPRQQLCSSKFNLSHQVPAEGFAAENHTTMGQLCLFTVNYHSETRTDSKILQICFVLLIERS